MLVQNFLDEKKPTVVVKGATVSEAQEVMEEKNFRIVFVVDQNGCLVGFLTHSTLKDKEEDRPVDSFLSRSTLMAKKDEPIDRAVTLIKKHNLMVLPVVDEDRKLIGVLTPGKLFEDLSELIGFGEGGFWISLPYSDIFDLPVVVRILLEEGANLHNMFTFEEGDSRQIMLKASGISDKSSIQRKLQEEIS